MHPENDKEMHCTYPWFQPGDAEIYISSVNMHKTLALTSSALLILVA